jgi:hypothetical protein
MKLFLMIFIVLLFSCGRDVMPITGNAGESGCNQEISYKKSAIYCLRDWLAGEDPGGYWQVIMEPVGNNIGPLLVGDNPCIEWSDQGCGSYQLMYIVGDDCCRDTSIITPTKCCLSGFSNCN